MACCKGSPIEFTDPRPEYQKEFQKNLFEMFGGGMKQGATPMPPEMFQALMAAYAPPSSAYGGVNILNNMAGQGPVQFNPLYSGPQPMGGGLPFEQPNYDPSNPTGGGGEKGNPTMPRKFMRRNPFDVPYKNPFNFDPRA